LNLPNKTVVIRCYREITGLVFGLLLAGNLLAQTTTKHETIMLGEITRNELEEKFPWFTQRYIQYIPSEKVVHKLKPLAASVTFVVIIGTWCSDSREHVPSFFKVSDQIGISPSAIRMIGVNRMKDRLPSPEIDSLQIEFVPTIIVFRNGKEIGRIVEDTKKNMETDLWRILKK
jgi:hypothetical protein